MKPFEHDVAPVRLFRGSPASGSAIILMIANDPHYRPQADFGQRFQNCPTRSRPDRTLMAQDKFIAPPVPQHTRSHLQRRDSRCHIHSLSDQGHSWFSGNRIGNRFRISLSNCAPICPDRSADRSSAVLDRAFSRRSLSADTAHSCGVRRSASAG